MILKPIELAFVASGILFVVSYLAVLYVWYVKLEEIESHLKKNTMVMSSREHWRRVGYIGRMMRFSMIFASFVFVSSWGRRKLLDMDEIQRFPRNLKCWIYIPFVSGILLMALMAALLICIENA